MEQLANALKGLLIGAANIIPGVSGGTIAVITGIYDRLISAVSGFAKGGEGGWKANLKFLLPILLGVGAGLFGFSFVMVVARDNLPVQTGFLFVGLIAGSLPFLFSIAQRDGWKPGYLIPFVLCAALVVTMAVLGKAEEAPAMRTLDLGSGILLFVSAIVGMGAMVVPGVSGSFVLLLFGTYATFITGIKEFNILILAVFGTGAVLGLVLITKILNLVLKRFHGYSYWGILGLVAGSLFDLTLRSIRPEAIATSEALVGGWSWPLVGLSAVLGAVGALLLSGKKKVQHKSNKAG